MKRLIHAEVLHLRSLKSTYFTILAIFGLTIAVAAADASEDGDAETFLATLMLMPAFGFALFAASRTAAEFRYETIAHRALASPRRSHLIAAKLAVLTALTLLVTSVTLGVGIVVATPDISVTSAIEVLVGTSLFAALGVAVGFLSRNQTTAVLVVFGGWVFEKLITALLKAEVLPYSLLDALASGEAAAGAGLALITGAAIAASYSLFTRKDVI
jgi:hypothetical protein